MEVFEITKCVKPFSLKYDDVFYKVSGYDETVDGKQAVLAENVITGERLIFPIVSMTEDGENKHLRGTLHHAAIDAFTKKALLLVGVDPELLK